MTIMHHPTEETLVAFAGAKLCEANSLVVATHLAHCADCRGALRDLVEVGGGLLEQTRATTIGAESRQSVMDRLDDTVMEAPNKPIPTPKSERALAPLSLYEGGKWQWVGPGVYRQFLDVPNVAGTRVFMLKAAPGTRLPDHRHVGTEWTCVLKGAFRHDHGRFGAGDFDEADGSVDHNPYVEEGEECICLVALNGHVEMTGWLGRLIQPLVRI